MKKAVNLKHNHEFRRLYSRGKSAVAPAMVVYCRKNGLDHNRFGFTVSTKIGCAVVRNRARRRLREVCRLSGGQMKAGYDLVVVARYRVLKDPFPQLMRQFAGALRTLNVWRDVP